MRPLTKFVVLLSCALAYRGVFMINAHLFGRLDFSSEVHWVFLPSGVRLVLVLLFGFWGAAGIAAGSVAGNWLDRSFDGDIVTATVAGILSGLAPLLVSMCSSDSRLRAAVSPGCLASH